MPPLSIQIPREPTVTPCRKFKLVEKIGQGGEGTVWRAISTSNQQCAVKVVDCGGAYERYLQLCSVRLALKHPYIVPVKRITWDESNGCAFIYMELCDGDLQQQIVRSSNNGLPEATAARYSRQILSALRHCHRQGIAHGDIKSDNLLVKKNGNVVKLCDFGSLSLQNHGHRPLSGSSSYMAPEGYDLSAVFDPVKADMWSFGITIYTMVAGNLPWTRANHKDEAYVKFCKSKAGDRNRYPLHFSHELTRLLDNLLSPEPHLRFSAAEISESKWIQQIRMEEQITVLNPFEDVSFNCSKRSREDENSCEFDYSPSSIDESQKRICTSYV